MTLLNNNSLDYLYDIHSQSTYNFYVDTRFQSRIVDEIQIHDLLVMNSPLKWTKYPFTFFI